MFINKPEWLYKLPANKDVIFADLCIKHHADSDDMCFPRNVVEMSIVCLESSSLLI